MYILPIILIVALFNVFSPKADTFDDRFHFKNTNQEFSSRKYSRKTVSRYKRSRAYLNAGRSNRVGTYRSRFSGGSVVGGRPAGCPHAYCGCASARYVGLSGAQWNLAANWLRLPRAAPAPGMAAARRGHVFILKHQVAGNNWMVYDPNSGGGLTRVHVRSLAGYTVVNPRGSQYARNNSYTAVKRKWRNRR